jgi:pimeloyl-ACP methyl ester carboxylesterase
MVAVRVNGVDIAYETHGEPRGNPLVLVGGLGQQIVGWHPDLVAELTRRGHPVVVYDNRDVGLSTHLHHLGRPDLAALLRGEPAAVPYTMGDMAADLAGLLDGLGIDAAHLFGASMGGMIAQTAAMAFPERVASLTSVMSHPGAGAVRPTTQALGILTRPTPRSRAEFVAAAEHASAVVGSPGFPADPRWLRERARRAWDRGHDPDGVARQLAAVVAQPDRTAGLAALRIPTLVVHGSADPLVPVLGGRLTAAAVPRAELVEIDGMGHDLPRAVWARVIDALDGVVHRGEAARRAPAAAGGGRRRAGAGLGQGEPWGVP